MSAIQVNRIHFFLGHSAPIYTVADAGDQHHFFSGSGDGMVVRWDADHPDWGERVAQLPNSVYAMLAIPETSWLVVGHNYEGIHLIDWQERKEVRSLKLGTGAIYDIQRVGSDLLVADGQGCVHVIDYPGWSVRHVIRHSTDRARCLAVEPALGHLAVGYSDRHVRVYSLKDYSLLHDWQAHENSVFAVHYLPGTTILLTGSRDARIKSWDGAAGYAPLLQVNAHLLAVNNFVSTPDGKHFVTCSQDKTIKLWKSSDLRLLKVIDKARHNGHQSSVNKALWMPKQDMLITASDDRSLAGWKIEHLNDPST